MPDKALSLIELQRDIKLSLDEKLDDFYWIVAEINELSVSSRGHCYMSLVEKDKDSDRIVAKVRGIIWAMRYRMLSAYFQKESKESLKAGLKVLVKARINYHELYGLSLNIFDIDPAYTLGDVERRRNEIIKKLQDAGIIEMNKTLELPPVIKNIAVISSDTAAGFGDFISQIETNSYAYVFNTSLFKAAMQGDETEKSVIKALEDIYQSDKDYDIVVIIRGGGAKADLSYFDNYNIAANVAQFPLPVFSGIGHERDASVTDMVAHKHLKTPTAVAAEIINYNRGFEETLDKELDDLLKSIKNYLEKRENEIKGYSTKIMGVKDRLHEERKKLDMISNRLSKTSYVYLNSKERILNQYLNSVINSSKNYLQNEQRSINDYYSRLRKGGYQFIDNENKKIINNEKIIKANDPVRLLGKGFSMTFKNGRPVRSVNEIKKGDRIKTHFRDGDAESEIL